MWPTPREEMKSTHVASRSSRLGTGGIEIVLVATDMLRGDEVKRSGGEGIGLGGIDLLQVYFPAGQLNRRETQPEDGKTFQEAEEGRFASPRLVAGKSEKTEGRVK